MLKSIALILIATAVGCIWKGEEDENKQLGVAGVILCGAAIAVYLIDWFILGN